MNQHDRDLLDHVFRSVPVDLDSVDFSELTLVGRATLALGAPSKTTLAWYRQTRGKLTDRVDNLLFLVVDEPEVIDLVDARIADGDAGVVEDLVRAGVPWSHPGLPAMLGDESASFAAAWLLTETEDDAVKLYLDRDEIDFETVIELLRPAAILGVADYFDLAADYRDGLEPGDEASRLDSLLCAIDPDAFLRRTVQGRSNWTWLGHAVSVADILHAFGPTTWLDTLAILEGTKAWDAFEFAASLAIAGSSVGRDLITEEEAQQFADILLDEELAEEATGDPRFVFATSIADDADLQALYVESAAHEEITRAGYGSPGLAGLPLSGGAINEDAVEAAAEFLGEMADLGGVDDDLAVGAVRTLCDLAYWALQSPDEVAPLHDVTEQLLDHGHASVKVAASQAMVAFTGERTEAHGDVAPFIDLLAKDRGDAAPLFGQEGCLQLAAVERLAAIGDEDTVQPLAAAWTEGSIIRSDVARIALQDALKGL